MKLKNLNEKYSFLTDEQRCILFCLTEEKTSTIVLPIKETKEVLSFKPLKDSGKVKYPDGSVKYRSFKQVIETKEFDLNSEEFPNIEWGAIALTEEQLKLKTKFYNYLKRLNNETTD